MAERKRSGQKRALLRQTKTLRFVEHVTCGRKRYTFGSVQSQRRKCTGGWIFWYRVDDQKGISGTDPVAISDNRGRRAAVIARVDMLRAGNEGQERAEPDRHGTG